MHARIGRTLRARDLPVGRRAFLNLYPERAGQLIFDKDVTCWTRDERVSIVHGGRESRGSFRVGWSPSRS